MTTPFITDLDVYTAKSDDPTVIGQTKLSALNFKMDMTDAEINALAAQAIALKNTYTQWAAFKTQLNLRKSRLVGFQSVILAMDVNAAAAAMNTTPALVTAVMNAYAQQESARIVQLEAMWNTGLLPVGSVLNDPSEAVLTEVSPVAIYTADVHAGTAPLAVQFTDASTQIPTTWAWDFGDGNSTTTQSPSHTFTTAGTYTVSLRASNAAGTSIPTTMTITVS